MTDHEKLNKFINENGGREHLASFLGISYGNVKNLLRRGRELPTWGKAILYAIEKNENHELPKPQ